MLKRRFIHYINALAIFFFVFCYYKFINWGMNMH